MTNPTSFRNYGASGGGRVGVPTDATARAVVGMSIGAIKSWQEMRERVWAESLDEYDQQFQMELSVETNNGGVWVEKDLDFNLMFVVEAERDSPYTTPLFTYGMEYKSGSAVFFQVFVKQWFIGPQGVSGCKLMIGAVNPGMNNKKIVQCKAIIHLNFQGYGGPVSDETAGDE